MNRVYIISYCIKRDEKGAYFHFNGVYKGEVVKRIRVVSEYEFDKNTVYLIDMHVSGFEDNILKGELIRCKKINFLF